MSTAREVNVIGAGGHAKVVISTLRAAGWQVTGVYDDQPSLQGSLVLDVPVVGPIAAIREQAGRPAIIAIGQNAVRRRISREYSLHWVTAIHPRACVDPTAVIEPGAVIFAGAIIQPCVRVGIHAIVNTAATVDHDCVLEPFVQLAPGVHLSGQVSVGEGAFLGTGSSTIQRVKIGAWAVVGAGAVVIRDLAEGVTAVGVPARVIPRKEKGV